MKSRGPQKIGDILAELAARHGFARVQSAERLAAAWKRAAGEWLAARTSVGTLERGVLEVYVASSALVQEIVFQKSTLLASLAAEAPDQRIRDLRLRVGPIQP